MVSSNPFSPTTFRKSRTDKHNNEYLFILLVGVVLVILWIASVMEKFTVKDMDIINDGVIGFMILYGARLVVLFLDCYFDREK